MSGILCKQETMEAVENQIEDLEYGIKTARSPMKKRSLKSVLVFFKSIKYHLDNEPNQIRKRKRQ